jgi:hypothetical protein
MGRRQAWQVRAVKALLVDLMVAIVDGERGLWRADWI